MHTLQYATIRLDSAYNLQYTPLPGQPPVFKFRNHDIIGFKKLYTASAS